jgi:inner membrane protein
MSRVGWFLKSIAVGFLSLVLLIPLGMINGTIKERMNYRAEAVASVAQSYAGAQSLAGPVLVIPFWQVVPVTSKDAYGRDTVRNENQMRHWLYFPKSLRMDGRLQPSIRKRGLHEVRVYELQSTLVAQFDVTVPELPDGVQTLGRPYLAFAIADVRGLLGSPVLTADSQPLTLQRGLGGDLSGTGLHARLAPVMPGQKLSLGIELKSKLAGTESLAIAPIADSNRITLSSAWPHPQFGGRFLPLQHRIDASGFSADWDISSLAAGTQGQFLQTSGNVPLDSLSLSLVEPVNVYTQADRASKYGILFVLLTFVGFFMFELIKRLAIHTIQYGLVGLALAIFFLLLLSLSEHIEFWIAYLIASVACIGLLGIYLSSVLKSRKRGAGFALMLTLLYAALYGLLISEDNALVLGSLMLFAILAAIMIVTRKIDWYALGTTSATES